VIVKSMQGEEQGSGRPTGKFPVEEHEIRFELPNLKNQAANVPTFPDGNLFGLLPEQRVQRGTDPCIAVGKENTRLRISSHHVPAFLEYPAGRGLDVRWVLDIAKPSIAQILGTHIRHSYSLSPVRTSRLKPVRMYRPFSLRGFGGLADANGLHRGLGKKLPGATGHLGSFGVWVMDGR
jgi:hypothetical protein